MATPLINALRVQGGTFYTFTSASNDISKTFTDDDSRFVFSKFALLDLPDVGTPSGNNYENYIVWEALGTLSGATTGYPNSSVPNSEISTDNNINFAQSFQNYVLNFEQLILDGSNTLGQFYNLSEKYTVAERLFWKWLANINAIRFRSATAAESAVTNRFTESDPTQYYKKVVKYIGDIDIVNSVSRDGHSYSEVYLNVPVTHGNTPLVLFKNYQDSNYSPGRQWTGGQYIDGRDSGSVHPTGLSLTAYYDNDVIDSYLSESTFGNITNVPGTASSTVSSQKPVLLSKMDGLILDTDADSYKPIVDDPNIALISEFNATDAAADFSFNAALVYYDTYSASNPTNRARNLYGILILDDYVNQVSAPSYLKRFDKFKPNKVTKLNGNGYGLKLNVKFDTSADNVGVETIINDYNTFSMDLFIDASTRMQEAAEQFLKQNLEIISIKQDISQLQQYFFSQASIDDLSRRLSALERSLNNSQLAFQSTTTLLDLINRNADNINLILSGNLPLNLTYNTDVLKQGDGIILDRSVPNQLKVLNKNQGYSNFMLCSNSTNSLVTGISNGQNPISTNVTDSNILTLSTFTNYFRQKNLNSDPNTGIETFGDTLYINIDDLNVRWKNGQILKFVFDDKIDTSGYNIIFRTDSQNIFGNGSFGKTMVIISPTMLISNRPIFEIYCVDENQYLFNVDVIR
jgi:hypothetical protein